MLPHFTNMAGFWGLLGIPFVIALHFLHHKTKERLCSTMFLLEILAPESKSGRFWDKLRLSRTFWLQILGVLFLTWCLVAPQWPGRQDFRHVVIVMDHSANMSPFRQEAIEATADVMRRVESSGIRPFWILLPSSSSSVPLYRGEHSGKAIQALRQKWFPNAGTHDLAPTLRTAKKLAGSKGFVHLITTSQQRVTPGLSATGVGRQLDNVGFSGITPLEQQQAQSWRIAIHNFSATAQQRTLRFVFSKSGQHISESSQSLHLAPRSVSELSVSLPAEADRAKLSLAQDEFSADDTLYLVRPVPPPVTFDMGIAPDSPIARDFLKLAKGLPGFRPAQSGEEPTAAFLQANQVPPQTTVPSVVVALRPSDPAQPADNVKHIVSAEPHIFTKDLNWGGLEVTSSGGLEPASSDTILLWLNNVPLAWLHGNSLILNWHWEESNAGLLPAPLLMIRRFLQHVQRQTPGLWRDNVPSGTRLPLPPDGTMYITPANGSTTQAPFYGVAPHNAGFLKVANPQGTLVFDGAVWFSDAKQGDFSDCRSFDQFVMALPATDHSEIRSVSQDPLRFLWILLAGCCMVLSWVPLTAFGRRSQP